MKEMAKTCMMEINVAKVLPILEALRIYSHGLHNRFIVETGK